MRLLVIEDDASLRKYLVRILEEEGFVVDAVENARSGQSEALTNDYDGIVIDLTLPDGHGVDVIKAVRSAGRRAPVLVFSGQTDSEEVIEALDAGADDYITKPTGGSLIRARVRALVRRGQQSARRRGSHEPLRVGNITLQVASRKVTVDGSPVQLTPKEMLLLQQLMLRAGEVVSRSELLEKVWDIHFDPGSNVVDTHVSRLRTKLRSAGATTELKGVRATGFLLEEAGATGSSPG